MKRYMLAALICVVHKARRIYSMVSTNTTMHVMLWLAIKLLQGETLEFGSAKLQQRLRFRFRVYICVPACGVDERLSNSFAWLRFYHSRL